MRLSLKRVLAGAAGLAAVATLVPLAMASPAAAAPSLQGTADISPNSSTNTNNSFNIALPSGAACAGDSANDNYRVGSYVVAKTVNPATLQFDSNGPVPSQFGPPQATFAQPLYDTLGSPYSAAQTANAASPPGPGPIINIPAFTWNVYQAPGSGFDLPPGQYNVGIACYIVAPGTSPIEQYWNTTVTVTSNPADPGPADISWSEGTPANCPTNVVVTPGNGELTVAFQSGGSSPADTSYTATATPGGASATGASSPLTITGLTNGTAYQVVVNADNGVGTSSACPAVSGTPVAGARTNVTGVSVTPGAPGSGNATVNWTEPGANSPPASPVSYSVVVSGPTASSSTVPAPATSHNLTGLAAGSYSVTVTANYADAPTTGTNPASTPVAFAVNPAQVLLQDIDVNRPVGALVLTQVCGATGGHPAVAAAAYVGFPDGLAAEAAVNSSTVNTPTTGGTAPTTGATPGGPADPNRPEYPYPTDANGVPDPNYPTHCGIDLGIAQFVTRGAGAGQYFAADGILNQVSVVDTRDDDTGWTITGTMSDFGANGPTDFFSGSQLGWIPKVTEDTAAFTDASGNTYDQTVTPAAAVAPNTAGGLGNGEPLASAAASSGLGTSILDARLMLLIPVTADAGDYTGTLTITAT